MKCVLEYVTADLIISNFLFFSCTSNHAIMQMNLKITTDSAQYAVLSLTCLYIFILTPISLYYTRKFWKLNQQNVPFITTRHAKVVMFSVICWNVYPTLIRSAIDLIQLKYHYITDDRHQWPFLLLLMLQSFQILISLICVRLWLLYYDYTHCVHTLNQKWKQTIINKTENDEISVYWTMKYKWLGNVKIIMSIGIFIACLFIFIIVLSSNINVFQNHFNYYFYCSYRC